MMMMAAKPCEDTRKHRIETIYLFIGHTTWNLCSLTLWIEPTSPAVEVES